MDARDREKDLILQLRDKVRTSEVGKLMLELLSLRLTRHKDDLVKEESGVVRGKAQEVRDLLKTLTENGGN
jgi:hypothetical protein